MPMWFRKEVEEVLLPMTIKPFLSHRRENASAVGVLRETLKVNGAGGWKDTEDLPIGDSSPEAARRAILKETGGFIWWGTRSALDSDFIKTVELPAALERQKMDPMYAIVPIFVDLDPGDEADRDAIRAALGDLGDDLLNFNGLTWQAGESSRDFRRRIAQRYVRDAVMRLLPEGDQEHVFSVSARALSEPSGEFDLTFDWRALIDASQRTLEDGASRSMIEALRSTREAIQRRSHNPEVLMDLDLPLPLAFLLGYEWRLPTRLRLVVRQRTGSGWDDVHGDGDVAPIGKPVRELLSGEGPVVVAVSCLGGLGETAAAYADRVEASELVTIHVEGILSPAELRGLASAAAGELRALNNRGMTKHLLLLGPTALAVFIGVASNAVGLVEVPFWDGNSYASCVTVGG